MILGLLFTFLIGILACAFAPYWADRVAVRLLRFFRVPVYSTAVMIAMSIVQHPEEWECRRHEMHHTIIGTIWTGNAAFGLHIKTAMGDWKPGYIERRIIREAVDWRLDTYIRNRVRQAMMSHALTGKVTEVTETAD